MAVKTFKVIKSAIWQTCNIRDASTNLRIPRPEQTVNLKKLRILMDEIKFLLQCHDNGISRGLSENRILKRFTLLISADIEA